MTPLYAYETCTECADYAEERMSVLVPAFVERKRVTGETTREITRRYFRGVHARHLDGLPIMPSAAA